jgi:hypothetical protein
MRVWVDLTNSPHVLMMRPLIEAMRAGGHGVEVTARDYALRTLTYPDRVTVKLRSEHGGLRVRRDPRELVKLLLSAADA